MTVSKPEDGISYESVTNEILNVETASRTRLKKLRALARVLFDVLFDEEGITETKSEDNDD